MKQRTTPYCFVENVDALQYWSTSHTNVLQRRNDGKLKRHTTGNVRRNRIRIRSNYRGYPKPMRPVVVAHRFIS